MDANQKVFYKLGYGDSVGVTVFRLRELVKELETKMREIESDPEASSETSTKIGAWATTHSSIIMLGLKHLANLDDGSGENHIIKDDAEIALNSAPEVLK